MKQEVICLYRPSPKEDFFEILLNKFKEEFKIDDDFIDEEKIRKIQEYKISKIFDHNEKEIKISINSSIFKIVKSAIKYKEEEIKKDD